MASDQKFYSFKENTNLMQSKSSSTSENKGILSTCPQWFIGLFFSILSCIGVMLYSLSISIVTKGQRYIHSDGYPVSLASPLVSCVMYTIIMLIIKLGKTCSLTSKNTCYIRWKLEKPYLILMAGVINVLALGIKLYAGLPERVPPHLNVILFSLTLPATLLWRYILTKRGVSKVQLTCVIAAFIGVIICIVPYFVHKEYSENVGTSRITRAAWIVAMCIAHVCSALDFVLIEIILRVDKSSPIMLGFYIKLITLIGSLALFWIDIIPNVGFVSSVTELGKSLNTTWSCMFAIHDYCKAVTWRIWLFSIATGINVIGKLCTIGYVQGSIYYGVIYCIPIPAGTLFWALFVDTGQHIYWSPQFNTELIYSIIGLCFIVPAMLGYYYFGRKISEKEEKSYDILH